MQDVMPSFSPPQLRSLHSNLSALPASEFDGPTRSLLYDLCTHSYGISRKGSEHPLGLDVFWRVVQDPGGGTEGEGLDREQAPKAMEDMNRFVRWVMSDSSEVRDRFVGNLKREGAAKGRVSGALDNGSGESAANAMMRWVKEVPMRCLREGSSVVQSLHVLHACIKSVESGWNAYQKDLLVQSALQMYWDCDVPNVVATSVVQYVEAGMPATPYFGPERNLKDRMVFLVETLSWVLSNHTEPDMGVDSDGNIKPNKLESILRADVLTKLLKYDNDDKECSGFNVVSGVLLNPSSSKFPGLKKYILEFLLSYCQDGR